MAKRRWTTDYRLWGLVAGAIFLPLGFVDLRGDDSMGEYSLWAYLRQLADGRNNTQALALAFLIQGLFLAIPAAAVGWLVQALIVMCGIRLTGRPDRQQARDYRELDAAEPDVAPVRRPL